MKGLKKIAPACLLLLLGFAAEASAEDVCRPVQILPLPDRPVVGVGGINNLGQVAANSGAPGGVVSAKAFVWDHGRSIPLEPLVAGGSSVAESINDWGQVVGRSTSQGQDVATLWTAHRPAPLPGAAMATGSVINNRGQIAGRRHSFCLFWRTPSSEPIVIADLGGVLCQPTGINDLGEVVGFTDIPNRGSQAFVWNEQSFQIVEAPASIGAGASTELLDINDQGVAVGFVSSDRGNLFMTWSRAAGARVVGTGLTGLATSVNDWSWATGVSGDAPSTLFLIDANGTAVRQSSFPFAVNATELYLNNRFQIAWNTFGATAYTCQLGH
ncbi:MAG: hypothetical protein JWN48_3980 [Myxococcaceae bacterium]|nr:hypothetical protein [Myxococcaceae bacterium]